MSCHRTDGLEALGGACQRVYRLPFLTLAGLLILSTLPGSRAYCILSPEAGLIVPFKVSD